jgi:hypothetical protein
LGIEVGYRKKRGCAAELRDVGAASLLISAEFESFYSTDSTLLWIARHFDNERKDNKIHTEKQQTIKNQHPCTRLSIRRDSAQSRPVGGNPRSIANKSTLHLHLAVDKCIPRSHLFISGLGDNEMDVPGVSHIKPSQQTQWWLKPFDFHRSSMVWLLTVAWMVLKNPESARRYVVNKMAESGWYINWRKLVGCCQTFWWTCSCTLPYWGWLGRSLRNRSS